MREGCSGEGEGERVAEDKGKQRVAGGGLRGRRSSEGGSRKGEDGFRRALDKFCAIGSFDADRHPPPSTCDQIEGPREVVILREDEGNTEKRGAGGEIRMAGGRTE